MNNHKIKLGLFAVLLGCAIGGQAADINAGKSKAVMCEGCHGNAGISNNAQWPNLAAQMPAYLLAQLQAFKSGSRDNPTMKGIAASLSDDDMGNLAAYFASLPAKAVGGDAELAKAGKDKAAMCLGCHGNQAQGQAGFPRLAGQHSGYLAKQLRDFKNGQRKGGPMGAMAAGLDEQAINQLAAYFASLR